jgi:hypothetical protein
VSLAAQRFSRGRIKRFDSLREKMKRNFSCHSERSKESLMT